MNEELIRKIADALQRRDHDALDRLHRAFVAEQMEWAKEGDVATARLLYFNGVKIDPALCDFVPTPPRRFPPAPRRVWRRSGRGELIALRVILLVLLAIWVCLAISAGEAAINHAFGQQVQGRVTALRRDDHPKGPHYYVAYEFDLGEPHISAEEEVSEKRFRALAAGSLVPVKTTVIARERIYELSFSAWESARFPQYTGLLFLTVMSSVITHLVWVVPLRHRRLIRTGLVSEGIVNEVTQNQKNSTQAVTYTFHPIGQERRRGSTNGPQRPRAVPNQHVSVFYDPDKPRHNVAYEFCDFETDTIS